MQAAIPQDEDVLVDSLSEATDEDPLRAGSRVEQVQLLDDACQDFPVEEGNAANVRLAAYNENRGSAVRKDSMKFGEG